MSCVILLCLVKLIHTLAIQATRISILNLLTDHFMITCNIIIIQYTVYVSIYNLHTGIHDVMSDIMIVFVIALVLK